MSKTIKKKTVKKKTHNRKTEKEAKTSSKFKSWKNSIEDE